MLKSPVKFSQSNRCIDMDPVTGSTVVAGLPATDAVRGAIDFTSSEVSGNEIDFGVDHKLAEDQPISFAGDDIPAPLVANATSYAKVIDDTTIEVRSIPAGTEITLTDGGTGTHRLEPRQFAKYVMFTNYGAGHIAFRPCYDGTYTISDTNVEAIMAKNLAHPFILNVMGFKCLATRAISVDSDLCVIPLENS